jgi:cyclophilin family peptidyl-prolyl cis-trans isomerase
MSFRDTRPQPRRVRRQTSSESTNYTPTRLDLPGPLRLMTNPKVFVAMGIIFAVAILASLFSGAIGLNPTTSDGPAAQANELADVARDNDEAADEAPRPTVVPVKRYTSAPQQTIDPSKKYTATIKTTEGDITLELYPDQAPEAVNAFVFLAKDGYYNGTPFMELVKDQNGSKFYAQAGDPTETGLGSPGFSVKKEQTSRPFTRGAVGMGGSSSTSNGGQFFISFGDYPALTGKYTIFGQVTAGLDVLDRLSLLDVSKRGASADSSSADEIQSVTVSE